jgi:hypothetical protein
MKSRTRSQASLFWPVRYCENASFLYVDRQSHQFEFVSHRLDGDVIRHEHREDRCDPKLVAPDTLNAETERTFASD